MLSGPSVIFDLVQPEISPFCDQQEIDSDFDATTIRVDSVRFFYVASLCHRSALALF